jgi:A/G-specific adenine glycosylase
MLQQTQVATVIPYFQRWMKRFPSVQALAAADEQEVLSFWQGLGYYNRARNLHRAAKAVVDHWGGSIPDRAESLLELPGVGRYTAGAVASIAFGRAVPLVDGNVERVLSRVYALREDPRSPAGRERLWELAGSLVPKQRPGDFNSALMELGATVCAPRSPRCLVCPVAKACAAREQGIESQIPPPKKAVRVKQEVRVVYCIRRTDGAYLLEQRPADGRWASMWQFPSREEQPTDDLPLPALPKRPKPEALEPIEHTLTHRRYTFLPRVYTVDQAFVPGRGFPRKTVWLRLSELAEYPLPKPHLTLASRLRG